MKNILLITFALLTVTFSFARIQEDSLNVSDTLKVKLETTSSLAFATRNVWRGISFGDSPSLQGLMNFNYCKLNIGAFGVVTSNGTRVGYGNTLEMYASYDILDNLSLTIDDYYFFNSHDSLDNYFEYGSGTQHYIEAQARYLWKESVEILIGYNIYSSSIDNTDGVYIQTTVFINDNISVFTGFLTGSSYLNFMDKRGVTNVGITTIKKLSLKEFSSVLSTSLILSPNHINIADVPGVGTSPVYFVASLTF